MIAGLELNALIAEKVFGRAAFAEEVRQYVADCNAAIKEGGFSLPHLNAARFKMRYPDFPRYSADVVERLRPRMSQIRIEWSHGRGLWEVRFVDAETTEWFTDDNESLPLAICKAALEAVRS